MGDDKNKLEYEVQTTLPECIKYLEELVGGLKRGQVVLKHRAEAIELRPGSVVSLGMKAKQKGAKESLEFEIEWKRSDGALLGDADPLRIEAPNHE